jgi:hypothetical protein
MCSNLETSYILWHGARGLHGKNFATAGAPDDASKKGLADQLSHSVSQSLKSFLAS